MRKKSITLLLIAVCGIAVVECSKKSTPTSPAVTPQPTSISGTVTDSLGVPVTNAAICIKYYFTSAVKSHTTASKACSLLLFTVLHNGIAIRLDWRTGWESSTYRWEIERSTQLDTGFVLIATIPAAGNIISPRDYFYIDNSAPQVPNLCYRLCEVDMVGHRIYYGPIEVSPTPDSSDAVVIPCPNPFTTNIKLGYSLADSSFVTIIVKNLANTSIKTLVSSIQTARYYTVLWNGKDHDNKSVPSGLYFSNITFSRHDSVFAYKLSCFLNINAIDTIRANAVTDNYGSFKISDLPIDSTFMGSDDVGSPNGIPWVADSITIYAAKGPLESSAKTIRLNKNTTNTVNITVK